MADNEVVDALGAKGYPRLAQREANAHAKGLEALLARIKTDRQWPAS